MPVRCAGCHQENRDGAKFCLRCGARLGEPGSDPLIGRRLSGRYRVVRVLGEGGMGRVYLAEQQLGTATRNVAIKVLHATHSRDETLRKRFYRECEVVVGLTHPNTIQFYDFGELEDGRLFIVMELVQGPSLADALAAGPMPLARVDRIVSQIAGSLGEAHARGVVHRDLKPDNILLTTRGDEPDFVKVCDFGIAKQERPGDASQLTLRGTVVGTPRYMSPEQLTGGTVDARSDVYSLALIAYEMLAGHPPFEARSTIEWATCHTTKPPLPIETFPAGRELPEHTRRALARALSKLPSDRPPSARAFAAELLGRSLPTPTAEQLAPSDPAAPPAGAALVDPRPDVTAPTLPASPVAVVRKGAAAGRSRGRTWAYVAAGLLAAIGLAAAGTGAAVLAGVFDEPGPPGPREWIRVVHQQRRITDAELALGPPDGRYAIVHPRGTLTLEIAAGTRIATDGGSGPDVWILIDDARSGPYRADVGVDRHQYTTVGSALIGSLPLDADQFGITRIRYVRIKNRGTRPLYLDAVGAARTVPAR